MCDDCIDFRFKHGTTKGQHVLRVAIAGDLIHSNCSRNWRLQGSIRHLCERSLRVLSQLPKYVTCSDSVAVGSLVHVVCDRTLTDKLVQNANYITILRSPMSHFRSAFRYWQIGQSIMSRGKVTGTGLFCDHQHLSCLHSHLAS